MRRVTAILPTRSISRLAGLTFAVVLILNLAAASAAFAEPLFLPVGATFTGTGGTETLEAGGEKIKCTANTSSGVISNVHLVGGITVDFTGCKSINTKGEECTAKSVGTTNLGLILTKTLHGVLGLILPKGTGTGVGLLLLPVENKKFWEFAENKCSIGMTVAGNLVGEVRPIGFHTTKGTLIFQKGAVEGGSIKEFDLSTGGLVVPRLEAFGKEMGIETTETVTWSAPVEVS
jgi:hypothetical protein